MTELKKRSTTKILAVVLIIVALGAFGWRTHLRAQIENERALMAEVKSVRTAVELYITLNKAFPQDLKLLTTEKYTLGNKSALYLSGIHVDAEKYPIDTFGHRFVYDPKTGKVQPGTKGYEVW